MNSVCIGNSGSGGAADNDGGTMLPEGNPAPPLPLQVPGVPAGEDDVVQKECTPHDGKHQLVGADRTIQTSDYTDQSQLVGSHSYHSVRSESPGTKYYITVGRGPDIAVTVDRNLGNTVNICINKLHIINTYNCRP